MPAKKEDGRKPTRPDFEEMARAVHASYLSRWARHADDTRERDARTRKKTEKISA